MPRAISSRSRPRRTSAGSTAAPAVFPWTITAASTAKRLQKQGDTVNAPAVAVGVNANDSALLKNVSGKTKAELGSDYFAHWAKGKN